MSIVACDDHAMFLLALLDALEHGGHEVAASTSEPNELLALVDEHRPDLVLLDVQLGSASGIEIAQLLRERGAGPSIILLTGVTDECVRAAYNSGMVDGLVWKGSALATLDSTIRRVLSGERVLAGWPAPLSSMSESTPLDLLTQRELEVLLLMINGASTAAMAERMGISANTVRTHVANVLQKLSVNQRSKAAHVALGLGLAATG